MHSLKKGLLPKSFTVSMIIVALLICAGMMLGPNAQATLEASADVVGAGFVSANVTDTLLMSINLNNGTGDNYTNNMISLTITCSAKICCF